MPIIKKMIPLMKKKKYTKRKCKK